MMIHCTGKCNSPRCTGLSKRNGTKFRELSLNFPKMARSLCIGRPSCLAAQRQEFSNRGTFLLHDPVQCSLLNRKWPSFASERATRNAVSRQFPATDLNLRRRRDLCVNPILLLLLLLLLPKSQCQLRFALMCGYLGTVEVQETAQFSRNVASPSAIPIPCAT